MKTRIATLPEAKKRLLALEKSTVEAFNDILDFLDDLGGKLDAFMQLKGEIGGERAASNGTTPSLPMPAGMSERVIQILRDSKRPMKPKDILERHQKLGWKEPKGGRKKLYEGISGSLSYLINRKGILKKTKSGYSLKQTEEKNEPMAAAIGSQEGA